MQRTQYLILYYRVFTCSFFSLLLPHQPALLTVALQAAELRFRKGTQQIEGPLTYHLLLQLGRHRGEYAWPIAVDHRQLAEQPWILSVCLWQRSHGTKMGVTSGDHSVTMEITLLATVSNVIHDL